MEPRRPSGLRRAQEFGRFAVVGGVGFCVEFLILSVLYRGMGWSPIRARLVSFSLAVTVTWVLNRCYTFPSASRSRSRGLEYSSYLAVQGVGAAINFAIYSAILLSTGPAVVPPEAALVVAAAAALLWNYLASRRYVFAPKS